jgi:hypothetical protein
MDMVGWRGGSGITYAYSIVELGDLPNVSYGNYIFAKRTPEGRWKAVYIGHGELSIRTDIALHERRDYILEQGATHVHFHENSSLLSRMVERADILEGLSEAS